MCTHFVHPTLFVILDHAQVYNLGFMFIRYLRKEHLTIMDVPMDAVRDGRIKWGTPPRWLNSSTASNNKSLNASINKIETGTELLNIS